MPKGFTIEDELQVFVVIFFSVYVFFPFQVVLSMITIPFFQMARFNMGKQFFYICYKFCLIRFNSEIMYEIFQNMTDEIILAKYVAEFSIEN